MWFRRKPFRFLCPYCGNPFFWVYAGMVRRRNRMPALTSLRGDLRCTDCGLVTCYDDFAKQHRGWL